MRLPMQRFGHYKSCNVYEKEIINLFIMLPCEFGHRTKGVDGWVQGRFMLTLSEKEFQSNLKGC